MGNTFGIKEYSVNYYDVDYKRRARITALINYFQDIAVLHSHNLGLTIDEYNRRNVAWVVYKWEITIDSYPTLFDTITIKTWPLSFRKFYAYRQFEVTDFNEKKIAHADATWFLIDVDKRKPLRVPEDFYSIFSIKDGSEVALNNWELPKEITSEFESEFRVNYLDIDTNKHVNNVKYVEWALETVPVEIITTLGLRKLRVIYEREAVYGETIKSVATKREENGNVVFAHIIYNSKNERLSLVETVWSEK